MATLPTLSVPSGGATASSDDTYASFTIDTTETLNSTLSGIPADFESMDGLNWTFEYNQTGRDASNPDTYALSVRIVNGATILAAADSGGTFATVDSDVTNTTDVTLGPTAFAYVNTSASKATWEGATVEYQQTYSQFKAADGGNIRVDYIALTGTYTQSSGTPVSLSPASSAITLNGTAPAFVAITDLPVSLSPAGSALTVDGHQPTAALTTGVSVTLSPPKSAMTFNGQAPIFDSISSLPVSLSPVQSALSIDGASPTVGFVSGSALSFAPAAAALTTDGKTPTLVTIGDLPRLFSPISAALRIDGNLPNISAENYRIEFTPSISSIVFSGYTPILNYLLIEDTTFDGTSGTFDTDFGHFDEKRFYPEFSSLSTNGLAPTLAFVTGEIELFTSQAQIQISAFAAILDFELYVELSPKTSSLNIATEAPELIFIKDEIFSPEISSITLDGLVPVFGDYQYLRVVPDTAEIAIQGAQPAILTALQAYWSNPDDAAGVWANSSDASATWTKSSDTSTGWTGEASSSTSWTPSTDSSTTWS